MAVVGIDLGTTNSCCAYIDGEGRAAIVSYNDGLRTTPSIFAIDDKGNELVGHNAKRQWLLNPGQTVYGWKRLLGRNAEDPVVRKVTSYYTYPLAQSSEGQLVLPIAGSVFTLRNIAAKILKEICAQASKTIGVPVTECVVTVPAYFDDKQRRLVKEAGAECDLDVLRVINEPTAAAIAYGFRASKTQHIAVFDLGGGTFDVSVIALRDNTLEVLATGGDMFLGGIDWDNAIMELIIGDFYQKTKVDLRLESVALQRIKEAAEQAKVDLSGRDSTTISIPFIAVSENGDPLEVNMSVSRSKIEEATQVLVDRAIFICSKVVDASGLQVEQLDELILVGGQTRWPAVRNAVTQYFGRAPSQAVHPDEAVAVGAAVYANTLYSPSEEDKVQLLDVLPMSIGIESAQGHVVKIFGANESIPNQKVVNTTTSVDGQSEVSIKLYQGESDQSGNCVFLGTHVLSGITSGPAGAAKIQLLFECTVDGTVSVSGVESTTGRPLVTRSVT